MNKERQNAEQFVRALQGMQLPDDLQNLSLPQCEELCR